MPENMRSALAALGLKGSEIRIYLACLESGDGLFLSEISKLTDIKRSSANLILDRLQKKGFITFRFDGARKCFTAESPESLLFQFEESLNDLRSLASLFRTTTNASEKNKVRFFEGENGIENIFLDILLSMKMSRSSHKEILAISSGKDIFRILPDHQKRFIKKRVAQKIPIRWIAPEGTIERELQVEGNSQFRKMKFFDGNKYPFNIEIDIYKDKIALINLGKNPSGVIIENENLTKSLRSLFNLVWNSL